MKILRKLTTVYTIGFGFLIIIVLVALFSFSDIYTSTRAILELTESMASKNLNPVSPESDNLKQLIGEIEFVRRRAFISFTFALFLASSAMFYLINIYRRNVIKPLREITSVTRKMAQGKFEALTVMEGTEIGFLMENLNATGYALKDKIKELENTIREKQDIVRTLNILNELNSSLMFKLKVYDVLETINSFCTTLFKTEASSIILIDKLSRRVSHLTSLLPEDRGDISGLAGKIMDELINKGMPVELNAPFDDKGFSDIIDKSDILIKNVLAVPIVIKGEILGALILINKTVTDRFTMGDEDIALTVSFQTAIAIEKAMLHEEIVQLAKTDGLSGLNNHRTFHEELDSEIKRARRLNKDFALLLLDIDHFKKFNDTYGHQGGDRAIKEISGVMLRNLRNIDSAARYGGDELAAILPETSLDGGSKTAERIRQEVSKLNIKDIDSSLTVSVGVAVFPADAINKESLIKAADDALYMATRMGRNRVITYKQYKSEVTK